MVTTNKFWNLKISSNETLIPAKIEKYSNGSIYTSGNECMTFEGSQTMSPFDFNYYTTTFTKEYCVDSCGVLIE